MYFLKNLKIRFGVSSFTALLEFATEKTAIIVGKPSKDFFMAALNDMKLDVEQAIMVGDDIGRCISHRGPKISLLIKKPQLLSNLYETW